MSWSMSTHTRISNFRLLISRGLSMYFWITNRFILVPYCTGLLTGPKIIAFVSSSSTSEAMYQTWEDFLTHLAYWKVQSRGLYWNQPASAAINSNRGRGYHVFLNFWSSCCTWMDLLWRWFGSSMVICTAIRIYERLEWGLQRKTRTCSST